MVPELSCTVGSLRLANPVLTASGTAGHGAELEAYFPLRRLGAHVLKSLSADAWQGNAPPRVTGLDVGMLNSVGLQGPGLEAWVRDFLPALEASGAKVVVSIWGRQVEDFGRAAALLKGRSPCIVALEVNVSCPNVEDRARLFCHSPVATAEVLDAARGAGLPLWAKLSPNTSDLLEVAAAAYRAGAEALTLTNTLFGLALDGTTRRPLLGAGGGGLSGPALHPVALRAVFDCFAAFGRPIVGVGGVTSAQQGLAFLAAGACAFQVGSATFADPRAPVRVLAELERSLARAGVAQVGELVGAAHR